MLVLTRKLMEKLYIGDEICVTVVRLEGSQVRLGIEAPRHISVIRAELDRRDHPLKSEPIAPATKAPNPTLGDQRGDWNGTDAAPLNMRRPSLESSMDSVQDSGRSDSRKR